MKADGVLNLLKFQRFQSVRMTSSLVRSTKNKAQTLVISRITALELFLCLFLYRHFVRQKGLKSVIVRVGRKKPLRANRF